MKIDRLPEHWCVALKLALTLPLLLWLSNRYAIDYAEILLPLYRVVLNTALHDYSVLSIGVSTQGGEVVVVAKLFAFQEQLIGNRHLPAGFTVDASTLVGHALKHAVIIVTAAIVWPRLTVSERLIRVLISLPLLIVIEALDIPLVLASAVRDLVISNVAPDQAARSWLIDWTHIMDGGGRTALSLAAACVAAWLQDHWMPIGKKTLSLKTLFNRRAMQ